MKGDKFTDEQLRAIYDVCSKKEMYGDWNAVADKLNKQFNLDYNESTYRKTWQYFNRMYNACRSFLNDNNVLQEIDAKMREFERAKIQFRDERNAWQRQNYIDARIEQKLDCLERAIKAKGREKYNSFYHKIPLSKNGVMIVCLSDLHIGAEYDSMWGKYNSTIAKERFKQYLCEVICIGRRHNISDVVVLGMGDLINNSIHKSIAITNRENVIEQIILASDLISAFIFKLCNHFNTRFINVSGNHSRIDRKEDALKDERLDKLIGWYVEKSLSHLNNFEYIECEDTSIGVVDILGQKIWVVHGDYDQFGRNGLSKLVLAMGYKPSAIFCGHLHSTAIEDIADVKFIRSGSFGGCGDDYTVEKRLTGKPSQTVVIFQDNGVQCIYPIMLD